MATYKSPKPAPQKAELAAEPVKNTLRDTVTSLGNLRSQEYKGTKTSGIKIRGTGAATKGTTARGPMA